ncbi:type I restriction endonuclease subunit R, EcoR124 family [Campylobacter devanensis]|uniref:type I restriction endonuclease subunit R, EcoR124 family n=1 Tax=Campylobacter devanensis TaxID=3161138 RepID=UPI003F6CEC00
MLLGSFEDYYYGYDDDKKHIMGYEEKISQLIQKYPPDETIIGESAKRDFIISFGSILRLRNILSSFDKFKGMEILSEGDFQNYLGKYEDLNEEFKSKSEDSESIKDDLVFEMELVRQLEVNIDYILMLVTKYHKSNCKDQEIRSSIDKAIRASMSPRSKKDLIDGFINKINADTDVMTDWAKFVKEQKESDLKDLIKDENLKESETRNFIDHSFRDGQVKTIGTDIEKILPPMGRFNGGNRNERKQAIIEKLLKFFDKYFGLGV